MGIESNGRHFLNQEYILELDVFYCNLEFSVTLNVFTGYSGNMNNQNQLVSFKINDK